MSAGVCGWLLEIRFCARDVIARGNEHRQDGSDDLDFHRTDQLDPGKFGQSGMASDAGEPVGPWGRWDREVNDRGLVEEQPHDSAALSIDGR